MKAEFVVIDSDGNVSYGMVNKNDAEPEQFGTFAKAEKRAKELATCEPGKSIKIFELAGEVIAPIGKIETFRRP
jgi:hypothetical protein